MKKLLSFILICTFLMAALCCLAMADTVTTSDSNEALDEFLSLSDWPVDEEEDSTTKGETVYPDEFAGMYVDDSGELVVCVTSDTEEIEQYYRDIMPNIVTMNVKSVTYNYNTLQHYMNVIEQRHVSNNLNIVNLYKIKDYWINYEENRIDIKMYSDQEYEAIEYLDGIFGDTIYIYFTDTTGEIDWYDEDYVIQREAEEEAAAAAEAESGAESEESFSDEVSEKAEETGFSFRTVALPIIIVALAVVIFFLYSKLRSKKINFDDDDYIDK